MQVLDARWKQASPKYFRDTRKYKRYEGFVAKIDIIINAWDKNYLKRTTPVRENPKRAATMKSPLKVNEKIPK